MAFVSPFSYKGELIRFMNRARVILLQGVFNLIFFIVIIGAFPIIHFAVMLLSRWLFGLHHQDWHIYFRNGLFALLIFFFRPIWRQFSQFADDFVYPQQLRFMNQAKSLRENLLDAIEYGEIFDRFVSGIQSLLESKKIIVYFEDETDSLTAYRYTGVEREYLPSLEPDAQDPLLLKLSSDSSPVILTPAALKKLRSQLAERFYHHGFRYIFPLMGRNDLAGIIVLGPVLREGLNYRKTFEHFAALLDSLAQALEHARLYHQAKREAVEKGILLEIGRKIASYHDMDEILHWMLDTVKEIVPYDAGGIFILDGESGTMTFGALRGYPPELASKANMKVDEGVVGWAVRTGKGDIVPDVSTDRRYYNARRQTKSQIVVPMVINRKIIGGLCLESDRLNAFTKEQYELLKTFASQAALVVENIRLFLELKQKESMEEDLKVARSVQRALFPRELPKIDGYSIRAKCVSLAPIGGDLYDVIPFTDGRIGIAIGDSSGKGIPGAILMATLFATFRGGLRPEMEVNDLVKMINNSLMLYSEPGKYSTFFYGVLDPPTGIFQYTNAGHNYPLLVRQNGEIVKLETGGTVLGFFKDLDYKKGEIIIQEGDLLIFYTDGVTELFNAQNEEFGEHRFIRYLIEGRDNNLKKLEQGLIQTLQSFSGGKPYEDDLTFIFIKKELSRTDTNINTKQ